MILGFIVNQLNIKSQDRNKLEADKLFQESNEIIENLETILFVDVLHANTLSFWGKLYNNKKNGANISVMFFILSVMSNPHSVNYVDLVNAFFSCDERT
jgi:hypothetical protein